MSPHGLKLLVWTQRLDSWSVSYFHVLTHHLPLTVSFFTTHSRQYSLSLYRLSQFLVISVICSDQTDPISTWITPVKPLLKNRDSYPTMDSSFIPKKSTNPWGSHQDLLCPPGQCDSSFLILVQKSLEGPLSGLSLSPPWCPKAALTLKTLVRFLATHLKR